MHRTLRAALVAIVAGASLYAPAALAEVIDDIAIERHDAAATIRLRLTGPVHYVRHYPAETGEIVVVVLDALTPEMFGNGPVIEEAKRSPPDARIPPFTVSVTVGQNCGAAANPVCIAIRFERPVRYRIRLGDDRRSVLLELPLADDASRQPADAGDKP